MIPKFRAWDKETECYRDVENINFVSGNIVCDMGWADKAETQRWNALLKEDDYVLEQSTGLFDKNGKEIFEGDIFEYPHLGIIRAVVVYENGCWYLDEDGLDTEFEQLWYECEIGKVIGDVHQNAELLEDE